MWLRPLFILIAPLLLLGTSQPLSAQEGKDPAPTAKTKAEMNLNGTWDFQTSDQKAYGVCDKGNPYSGKLTINQKNSKLTLVFQSGPIVCSPPTACAYKGKLIGNDAHLHNVTIVAGEGGSLLNSIHLTFTSPTSASGKTRTIQERIGGTMCEWTHQLQLIRKK